MAKRRSGSPRRIRDLIGVLRARSDIRLGVRRTLATDAIDTALLDVLGVEASGRCRIGSSIGTVVTLECHSNAVAQRVRFAAPEILGRVQAQLEAVDVTEIRVVVSVDGWPDVS